MEEATDAVARWGKHNFVKVSQISPALTHEKSKRVKMLEWVFEVRIIGIL